VSTPEPDVEGFLRGMDWRAPSADLDRRVTQLTRTQRTAWRGYAFGTAVSTLTAALVFMALNFSARIPATPASAPMETAQRETSQPARPAASDLRAPEIVPASAKPLRMERVFNTGREDRVLAENEEQYRRIQGQTLRQIILFDPKNQRRVELLIPEEQYVLLRSAMY